MRILALDIGKKRIGLAISHSGIIASEYLTLENNKDLLKKISDILAKENIEKIIIGLPQNMDGTESVYAKEVLQFAEKLRKVTKIFILFEDERLTTKEAERQLREQGVSSEDLKKRIDQYAAKLILEQYLQ